MLQKDVTALFKEFGWHMRRDDVSDQYGYFLLEDRQIAVGLKLRQLPKGQVLYLDVSVSIREFTELVRQIEDIKVKKWDHVSVISDKNLLSMFEKTTNFTPQEILEISDKIIAWGKAQNLEEGLKKYRELPTDCKGSLPLDHFAALAMAGDVDNLQLYKDNFEKGDRMNFVPYITVDYIDRALKIAHEYREKINQEQEDEEITPGVKESTSLKEMVKKLFQRKDTMH